MRPQTSGKHLHGIPEQNQRPLFAPAGAAAFAVARRGFLHFEKRKNWQIAVVERAILVRFSKLSQFT